MKWLAGQARTRFVSAVVAKSRKWGLREGWVDELPQSTIRALVGAQVDVRWRVAIEFTGSPRTEVQGANVRHRDHRLWTAANRSLLEAFLVPPVKGLLPLVKLEGQALAIGAAARLGS